MDQALTDNASLEARPATAEAVAPSRIVLAVPQMMCGTCVRSVEDELGSLEGVSAARVNLSQKRVYVTYDGGETSLARMVEALDKRGFKAAEFLAGAETGWGDRTNELLPRVGVAGFAAANIMLLSVSVWSGHASDMDAAVKGLFHWISALIALPAIAYAGQPFFTSALGALRGRRLNMDVPISLGILLATAMSLFQTMRGTEQVYFDAAVTLVFFLLVGRTLDEQMRARARGAAANLLSLRAMTASVIDAAGTVKKVAARDLKPGDRILVAAGERIAGDGTIISGRSDIDESLITGETVPRAVEPGMRVHAGTVNGGQPLEIEATAAGDNTLLAEIAHIMLTAEQGRGHYVRLADRAARLYAPAVHVLGLATFTGWMIAGAGWETSLTYAIAVLIITCPCALALAVPAVQVAATSRLFRQGVIVKTADGLERIAETDTVVLDKTGTLTLGTPVLENSTAITDETLAAAAALAAASRHPYAEAVVRAARERGLKVKAPGDVREEHGAGLTRATPEGIYRLGSARWLGLDPDAAGAASLWFAAPGAAPLAFRFVDRLRADAAATVGALQARGYKVELLSGDRREAVAEAAHATGIEVWHGAAGPDAKLARLDALKARGRHVLMVGDGLNDAPALAAGHASMSPATAVEISQTAADAVFQNDGLGAVVEAIKISRAAIRLAVQNFAIAILYNAMFVPLAAAGKVTPLLAAIAMSTSSILVTGNALRLRAMRLELPPAPQTLEEAT